MRAVFRQKKKLTGKTSYKNKYLISRTLGIGTENSYMLSSGAQQSHLVSSLATMLMPAGQCQSTTPEKLKLACSGSPQSDYLTTTIYCKQQTSEHLLASK